MVAKGSSDRQGMHLASGLVAVAAVVGRLFRKGIVRGKTEYL